MEGKIIEKISTLIIFKVSIEFSYEGGRLLNVALTMSSSSNFLPMAFNWSLIYVIFNKWYWSINRLIFLHLYWKQHIFNKKSIPLSTISCMFFTRNQILKASSWFFTSDIISLITKSLIKITSSQFRPSNSPWGSSFEVLHCNWSVLHPNTKIQNLHNFPIYVPCMHVLYLCQYKIVDWVWFS